LLLSHSICKQSPVSLRVAVNHNDCSATNSLCHQPPSSDADGYPRRRADRHLIHGQKDKRIVTGQSTTDQCRKWQQIAVAHGDKLARPTAAFRLANSVVRRLLRYFFRECSRRRLVNFDNGPIDGEQRPINVAVRMETDPSFFEDHVPCAVELPKSMPCMNGTSFSVHFWNVSPGSTGFEDPQNTVDHSCVVRAFFGRVRC